MKFSDRIKEILFLFGCAIMFNFPAFLNGFPLVTSDSGTYMSSGFGPDIPFDRPVFYGMFVRHFSLKESLWFVVIVQGLIAAWILSQAIKQFLPEYSKRIHRFFIFLVLSLLTTLPWFCSQIMADFFSPIPAICIALLLLARNLTMTQKIFTALILIFSTLTHNSHLLVNTFLIIVLCIVILLKKYFSKKIISPKRFVLVSILVLCSWFLAPFFNYLIDGKYRHSGSAHVFLLARFAESGILADYLKRNCICNEMESFKNDSSKFVIIAKHSRKCLDVESYSKADNAKIQQWSYVNGPNQKYHVIPVGNDLYKLISFNSGKAISIVGLESTLSPAIQISDTGGAGQVFRFIKAKDNYVLIQSPVNNEVLEIKDLSEANGTTVQLNKITEAENQLFRVLPDTTDLLCLYEGKIPRTAIDFIWAPNSIFFLTGGFANTEKEYTKILKNILTTPRYLVWNVRESIVSTIRQLVHFDAGNGIFRYDENSAPGGSVRTHYKKDFNSYITSLENTYGVYFTEVNKRIFITMFVSSIILLIFFFKRENFYRKKELWILTLICVYSVILNAFVNGAMANVLDRLQSRIVWLIPFCAILLIYGPVTIFIGRLKEYFLVEETDQ